jgi:MmyB-like transcription regulator ligand binding domain
MWSALHSDPAVLPAAERNLARALFGNGAAHAAMLPVQSERGQDALAASIVANLKDAVSRYPADAHLDRLVHDLRGVSDAFARHWATQTAAAQHTTDRKTIQHPEIGNILLDCDVLIVPGADLRMVTYTAAAGSSDAGKLDLLRAAPRGPSRPQAKAASSVPSPPSAIGTLVTTVWGLDRARPAVR